MRIWGSGAAGRRHAGSSAHFIISRKTKPEVYFPNKAPGPSSARWSQTPSLTFLPAAGGNGSFFKPRASFPAQPALRSDPPPGPGVPSAAGAASIVPGERGPASPVGTPSTPGMSPALLYPPPPELLPGLRWGRGTHGEDEQVRAQGGDGGQAPGALQDQHRWPGAAAGWRRDGHLEHDGWDLGEQGECQRRGTAGTEPPPVSPVMGQQAGTSGWPRTQEAVGLGILALGQVGDAGMPPGC